LDRKLTAILYADVAGYSRLTGADEKGTYESLMVGLGALTEAIEGHGGRVVNTAGDAVLAEFVSVVTALECAVAAQRDLAERDKDVPDSHKLQFRIGVNLGDVIVDGDEIYGNGVNVAARLETLADPGGICISGRVLEQVEDKLDVGYAYLGPQSVKNIKKPVNVYKVLLDPKDTGKTISLEKIAFALPDKPSIAVLPFDNLSASPGQDFLADGLTENIIATLARVADLFVIARASSNTYKGRPVKVQQVAEELGVRYVLEGSVQRAGERVRVTAQLIDALTGHHLWAERYDREIEDIFALQDELALKIAVELQINLTEGEQARIRYGTTNNIHAWEKVVTALPIFFELSRSSIRRARALLEQALELDPQYALASTFLAWCHLIGYRFGFTEDAQASLKQARDLANKTLRLGPDLPEVHAIFGMLNMVDGRFDDAVAAARKAADMAPGYAEILAQLGQILVYAGDWKEALEVFERAARLHRFYPSWYSIFLCRLSAKAGDLDRAVQYGRDGILRAGAEDKAMKGFIHGSLAFAYATAGRMEEARKEMAEGLRVFPQLSVAAYRRVTHYRDPAELEQLLEVLRTAGLPETPPRPVPDKPSIVASPFDNP
jgi:adenylate cyclase